MATIENIFYRIKQYKRLLITLFIIVFVIFISPFIINIIIKGKEIQFFTLLLCILASPAIILKPIRGIILLPVLSYIIPPELHYNGISMGLAISAITMFSSLIYVISGKSRPQFSWLWVIIMMLIMGLAYFANNEYVYVKIFIQGIAPFVIFSFVIKKESEARMVIKYWLASFSVFCLIHIIRGGVLFPDESIIRSISSIRSNELGGYNPNTLGWLSLLYIAICPSIALATHDPIKRRRWWYIFIFIVLLIIFSFSKAAMAGLLLTFILLLIFIGGQYGHFMKLLVPFIFVFAILSIVWNTAVAEGAMDQGRVIGFSSASAMSPELNKRVQMIVAGWILIFDYPWGYGNGATIATHSAFTKAALDYGIVYLFIFCIPFFYLIRGSYVISRKHYDLRIRMLSLGILVAGLVSIPQAIFGATMFSASYSQVFWLFAGYVSLVNKELNTKSYSHLNNKGISSL